MIQAEKATQLLSDGGHSDGDAPRPPMPQVPPPATPQDVVEVTAQKNRIPNVEIPAQLHLSPRIPEFISMDVGSSFGFGGLKAATAGQVAREDFTTTKGKVPNSKHAQKRRIVTSTHAITISPMNMPLGSMSGLTSPSGEKPQGPSPVDNNLELDVDFPINMVAIMQEGTAKKAHKIHRMNHRK